MKVDADLVDCIIGVHCYFNDAHKVALWFNTENLNFGGIKPVDMIKMGRAKKLRKFINNALEENKSIRSEA